MSALTKFQTTLKELMLLQTDWVSKLNPLLANPCNNASLLKDIKLTTGSNTINHRLGRTLQGWSVVRTNAAATIYETPSPLPDLTLVLVASTPVTVTLEVF